MGTRKRPTGKAASSGEQALLFDQSGYESEGEATSLQWEARRRYLNYALSVITARALPDVRDGLKPVQRRILYAMHADEHLHPDAKHRKSAKVVGAVIGRYHPHGDSAVYDAMVRMAQDFALREILVDGAGNFGSLDGDSAAAYRYTECRLAPIAMEMLRELNQDTVPFRDNFDATTQEPVVLPSRFPNLLVNGCTGIAVGMATNIPPHNLREVVDGAVALIDDRKMKTTNLLKYIKGPDFPTGGQVLNTKVELRQIYDAGHGPIRARALYKTESRRGGGTDVIVTSVPYAVNKSTLVEKIADVIIKRKLPQLVDVRDESTTDVRIVLEVKKDADVAKVMAYLYKNTPLQTNFNVNLTCLIPTQNPMLGQPARVGIKELLEHFVDFRFDVIKRRFEFELAALRRRIHILEGFVVIFDALDRAIKIIRQSDGKKDAANKLMKAFKLDAIQVDAILELKLYKLAKLEINIIREELAQKIARAKEIEKILASKAKMWKVVKTELREVAEQYGTPRRTKIGGAVEEVEFDDADFIVDEDAHVVLSQDGWIKRLREVKDVSKLRTREGDRVMAILAGSTKENVAFFSNYGAVYVTKINDIPATTGYGNPAQKLFRFKDGERIIAAMSFDPRVERPETLLSISSKGFGQRTDISPYLEVTTRAGRRYAKPAKGDEIVDVVGVDPKDIVVVGTRKGHVLLCAAKDINQLENPGKGVTVIKTAADDAVIAFTAGRGKGARLQMHAEKGGKKYEVAADPKKKVARGGKGQQIVKRAKLVATTLEPLIPALIDVEDE